MFCLDDSPWFQMIELGQVDSTNNFARSYRPLAPRRLTLITAEYQTQGRGAGTNSWESAEGKNLVFSFLTYPSMVCASQMFVLSEALALAISDAFNEFHPGSTIKWPNDIYYGDRKVAGMLIENDLKGKQVEKCVMGVGMNINQAQFVSDAPNPVSLFQLTGQETERRFVLEAVVKHFTHYYERIERGNCDDIHTAYLQRLYRKGEEHTYSDEAGEFRAVLETVEPTGHLVLRDSEGLQRRYAFKEVNYKI